MKTNRGNILVLLNYAVAEGVIESVPRVPTIRQEQRQPTAWTLGELRRLVAATTELTGNMRDLPISRAAWFKSLILFLYDTGLRVSSTLTLASADLSLDNQIAIVRADGDKTWADQVVGFSGDTRQALQAVIGDRETVWPYPWTRRKLWDDLKRIRKAAGLPTGPRYAFHCVRRTHATQTVIAAGWDAARVSLRHSSEQMTRRYVDQSQVRSVRIELPSPVG